MRGDEKRGEGRIDHPGIWHGISGEMSQSQGIITVRAWLRDKRAALVADERLNGRIGRIGRSHRNGTRVQDALMASGHESVAANRLSSQILDIWRSWMSPEPSEFAPASGSRPLKCSK